MLSVVEARTVEIMSGADGDESVDGRVSGEDVTVRCDVGVPEVGGVLASSAHHIV